MKQPLLDKYSSCDQEEYYQEHPRTLGVLLIHLRPLLQRLLLLLIRLRIRLPSLTSGFFCPVEDGPVTLVPHILMSHARRRGLPSRGEENGNSAGDRDETESARAGREMTHVTGYGYGYL
jgi:hypothetical protein